MKATFVTTVLTVSVLLVLRSNLAAGVVTFTGLTSSVNLWPPFETGSVVLGTFDPNFDPHEYGCRYGFDSECNMNGTHYGEAVSDGVFRPIQKSPVDAISDDRGWFAGQGLVTGLEGQQLWLFVFNDPDPDLANLFILCSGSTESWFAPSDLGSTQLVGESADEFVFGLGGHGEPLEFQILPIPETPFGISLGFGSFGWFLAKAVQRRRKAVPHKALTFSERRGPNESSES